MLEILKRHQVKVFRTDRDGAVQYLFGRGDGTFLLHPPYDKVYSRNRKKTAVKQSAVWLAEGKSFSYVMPRNPAAVMQPNV